MAKEKIAPAKGTKTAKTKVAPTKDIGVEVLPDDGKDSLPALELVPYIDANKDFELRGNYEKLEAALKARRDTVMKTRFSAKDLDTVTKYKKEAQGYRTMLSSFEKDYKTRYFNAPKDAFAGRMASLQAIVAEIETKADKILQAEEEKRVAALTEVLDIYKADFQAQYKLSQAGLDSIEYKGSYYNKTAKDVVTKADMEEQFRIVKRKEDARASGEKIVRNLCAANPLLDVERYVKDLESDELANIVEAIEAEKARLAEAEKAKAAEQPAEVGYEIVEDEPAQAPAPSSSASGKLVIGVKGVMTDMLSEGSDFPGKLKKLTVEISYPVDFGEALTEIFKELAKYGIKAKVSGATF